MAKKKKIDMGFESIKISVVKNGYLVEPKDTKHSDESYVFNTLADIMVWAKEEMSPFTEERDFIQAL